MVGETVGPLTHDIDARWTMSYSAALGDTDDCYFNTRLGDGRNEGSEGNAGIVAHPLFPVCVEWPVIVSGRDNATKWGITPDETRRSVHATHDVIIHRLVRPGDMLNTALTYSGVEQRKPGAYTTMRIDTTAADGQPVCTTYQGGFHLGVEAVGPDRSASSNRPGSADAIAAMPLLDLPAIRELGDPPATPMKDVVVPVAAGAAHTYTEGARIWNPIHTDAAVAEEAGLPAIILHGTATLALGVSAVLRTIAPGQPELVRRIVGRFGAMVLMPSTLTVRIHDEHDLPAGAETGTGTGAKANTDAAKKKRLVRFSVLTEDGDAAVDQGAVVLGG